MSTVSRDRNNFAGGWEVNPIPFAAFQAEFLELYQEPLRAKKTACKMRQVLNEVAALIGPDGMTDALTPQLVGRFIAARPPGLSNNTTHSLLRSLRAACNYAMESGYLRISPFLLRRVGSWVRKEKSRRPRQHISREEIANVLAKAKAEIEAKKRHSQASPWAVWRCRRLHALAVMVAYTGMRKMEALNLRIEDVDLAAGFISIVARRRLKTMGSERVVPIASPLAAVLADWIPYAESDWLFPNSTHKAPWLEGFTGYKPLDKLKALGRRAGVPDLTFLALRHSFATHAIVWGLTPVQIAAVMGHTGTQMQLQYQHSDPKGLLDLVNRIDFGQAGGGTKS